jgi:hypothetical protein
MRMAKIWHRIRAFYRRKRTTGPPAWSLHLTCLSATKTAHSRRLRPLIATDGTVSLQAHSRSHPVYAQRRLIAIFPIQRLSERLYAPSVARPNSLGRIRSPFSARRHEVEAFGGRSRSVVYCSITFILYIPSTFTMAATCPACLRSSAPRRITDSRGVLC